MDYHFEEVQGIKVAVYDVDDKRHIDDLSRHDFIGVATFTLGEVVAAGQVFTRRLTSTSKHAYDQCITLWLEIKYSIVNS